MRNFYIFTMHNSGYNLQPSLLFWIKLKTLTINNCISRILQIAYVYTDLKLSACQVGSHFVLHCNKQDFQQADKKQVKLFQENGLYEACMKSKLKIQQAQRLIMKEIEFRKIARGQFLAAGKQVHLAKNALMHHMPKLHDFLHYRIFDLSSVQLVIEGLKTTKDQQGKRANQEVWQDINQMQFYFQHALNDN